MEMELMASKYKKNLILNAKNSGTLWKVNAWFVN